MPKPAAQVELEHENDALSARKALFNDPDFIAILKAPVLCWVLGLRFSVWGN